MRAPFWLAILMSLLMTSAHAKEFSLSSTSLTDELSIPKPYTCDGINMSPEMDWQNAPQNTQTFALIVSDPDAPGGTFYHWVIYNLPKSSAKIPENAKSLPIGTQSALNSFGNRAYNGPCPPKGSTHHYIFSLYALNTSLQLADNADAAAVKQAMQNHVLGVAEFSLEFGH